MMALQISQRENTRYHVLQIRDQFQIAATSRLSYLGQPGADE